jgi:hypothetical protein
MNPGIELKIANSEETAFLLQAELNSIKRGSIYTDDWQVTENGISSTKRGYINFRFKVDGPVITTF